MAVPLPDTATAIGRTLAEAVGHEPAVTGVWVRPDADLYEVWILTEPISHDEELRLYQLAMALDDTYPDTLIRHTVVNSAWFAPETALVGDIIPVDALPIAMPVPR